MNKPSSTEQIEEELSREVYGFERGKYSQKCDKCGEVNVVLTQRDECPEYYTTVITYCKCGRDISWMLPVN